MAASSPPSSVTPIGLRDGIVDATVKLEASTLKAESQPALPRKSAATTVTLAKLRRGVR